MAAVVVACMDGIHILSISGDFSVDSGLVGLFEARI